MAAGAGCAACLSRNEQGEVLAWYGIISDVTTEHELALRVWLEQQLRNVQSSASLARLATAF
jgi:hypothetical protein